MSPRWNQPLLATITALFVASAALAAVPPTDRCIADKTGAMGKYSACILKAKRGLVLNGDNTRFANAIAKCDSRQSGFFVKSESKAGSGICPVDGDSLDLATFTNACLSIMSDAIGGEALPLDLAGCYDDLADCSANYSSCDSALSACLATLNSSLLATGQTDCTDATGAAVSCASSGQDGEYQAGIAPAYVDNGDGTITDTITGLMWEKLSNDGSIHDKDTQSSWSDGLAKIATLNSTVFAGYTDWRMPNIRELETLVNFGRDFPTANADFNTACAGGCTVLTCNCTRSFSHWTSTSYDTDKACAWSVDFSIGTRSGLPKTSLFHVRAVRGGI